MIQPVAKLSVIGSRIIFAISGPVGLGQLFEDRLRQLWNDKAFGRARSKTVGEVMRLLRDEFFNDVQVGLTAAQLGVSSLGPGVRRSVLHSTVVALGVGRDPELIQFDSLCQPEVATADLPHVAIGSGQSLADPFLAFLRRVFWSGSSPTVADGVFAAIWTLRHSIRVSPGGVSDPISVATLTRKGQDWQAREIDRAEREEHEQHVEAAEAYLSEFPKQDTDTGVAPPSPPQ